MELEGGTLKEDMQLEDIEEWDSISRLSLMVVAKNKFEKELTAETIRNFVTVKDICDFLG